MSAIPDPGSARMAIVGAGAMGSALAALASWLQQREGVDAGSEAESLKTAGRRGREK